MHSMYLRQMMFVFHLFIITDETTFIPLKAVLMIKSLLTKLRKLKAIVDNYYEMHRSLMRGWKSLKLLSVTKGTFDT